MQLYKPRRLTELADKKTFKKRKFMMFNHSLETQGAKEIVLELGKLGSCLVPETSRDISSTVYPDNASSEERRRHKMGDSECDDGSQHNQRNSCANQQWKYGIRPESSAKRVPKPPKHSSR